MPRGSRSGDASFLGLFLSAWTISIGVLAIPAQAQTSSATADAASIEERLKRQDDLIRQLAEQNKQLAEQNKRLGQKLESISHRLDSLTIPASATAGPPAVPTGESVSKTERPPLEQKAGTPGPPDPTLTAPLDLDTDVLPENLETPIPAPSGESRAGHKGLIDSLHHNENYGFKALFDSLHPAADEEKPWYERLSVRGYTQVRYDRTLYHRGANPSLLGDAGINGVAEDFSIRRARLILFGDVSDRLSLYFQADLSHTPIDSDLSTYFGQLRDLYADVYLDSRKINRFRVGQSKVPYGFDNMQSSGNRVPIDRTTAMDSAVFPNQRDLGVFYYWTPVRKQKLLSDLVDGGLKGSGNYGIFALGVYNGQGGSLLEQNLSPHAVARFTWPFLLQNGQAMELSLQGYTGLYVSPGTPIRPLGRGPLITPLGTDGHHGIRDQRIAGTFVYYPQPFGFQAEWNVGRGPGLNNAQTAVDSRSDSGGYAMGMYKFDTPRNGIFIPYVRYQYYRGGYRAIPNSPYGTQAEWNLGVEWQIRREMELVTEYTFARGINFDALTQKGATSYEDFNAGLLRFQFQFNY